MEEEGEGSQGVGARSEGEPNEQDVLSAKPSLSEPGLASESANGAREYTFTKSTELHGRTRVPSERSSLYSLFRISRSFFRR